MADARYSFDIRAGRFRDGATGRFLPEGRIRAAADAVIDGAGQRLQTLTARLQTGSTTLAEWQDAFRTELKNLHVSVATVAHGGQPMMDQASYGWTGQRLREQYGFLNRWAADLANGTAPLDGRMLARAQLYAVNATATYEGMKGRDARNSGAEYQERNISGSKDPCSVCPALSALGWQPGGSLIPVGSRPCLSRCRCRIERRLVAREVAA